PQYPGDVAPVLGEAGAAALGMEVVLVPEAMLLRGGDRLHRARDVLDVVAGAAHQAARPLGPQGRHDATGTAAPVVAHEDRARDFQRVHELQEVVTERGL